MSQPSTRRGFTIIELLVVIAIIIILVSLLLPGLRSVQLSVRNMKCVSNLSQIAGGMFSYHKNTGNKTLYTEIVGVSDWTHEMTKLGVGQDHDSSALPTTPGVLRCSEEIAQAAPSEPQGGSSADGAAGMARDDDDRRKVRGAERTDPATSTKRYSFTSYGINGGDVENPVFDGGYAYHPHRRVGADKVFNRLEDFARPRSMVISIFDGFGQHLASADYHSLRHYNRTRINVLLFDGHVESMKTAELSSTFNGEVRDRNKMPSSWYK